MRASNALIPFLIIGCGLTLLSSEGFAAPNKHSSTQKVARKAKAKPSAPVNMDNGVIILGDGSTGGAATMPAAVPAGVRTPITKPTARSAGPDRSGARLVGFCRSYLGRKLGNGQCTELAALGLPAIGAQPMPYYVWGTPVCRYSAVGGHPTYSLASPAYAKKGSHLPDVRPGDIIQYEGVRFERHWDGGYSYNEYPHHTAVIEQVSRDGLTYKVLEQNVNNTQIVLETTLHMSEMTQGTMSISRPIAR